MQRKDTDIYNVVLSLFLVVGLLLFAGSLNVIISGGISANNILWAVTGLVVATLTVVIRIIRTKRRTPAPPHAKTREMFEEIIKDGIIDEQELNHIKSMKVGK